MPTTHPVTSALKTAVTLAELLQRVESRAQPVGAAQYRQLVQHLSRLLDELPPGPVLDALLTSFPAAATLYENLQYERAGLCRSPLEASLTSELQARALLQRAAGREPR